jgi:hypothetical protein
LHEKIIRFKARGLCLRELPIYDIHCWETPVAGNAYRLLEKNAFLKPARRVIVPGKITEKDNPGMEAPALADMPSRYTLVLDGGLRIRIKPTRSGVISLMGAAVDDVTQLFVRPISFLWRSLFGRPYAVIDVVLEKNDAKAVYWSFLEGSVAIIYPP